jgi:lipopolysaccharide biosynthesis regulator YciM
MEGNPGFRQAHFSLGRLLVDQQQYQEGIEQLIRTLTPVDEDTPTYLYALGAAYGRAGDSAKGLQSLEQAKGVALERGQTAIVPEIEKALESVRGGKASRLPATP